MRGKIKTENGKEVLSMATVSFDEKVVVTDPEIVMMMKKDLDSAAPVEKKRDAVCTAKSTDENGKKWATKLLRSVR